MKNSIKWFACLGLALTSGLAFAQKTNETSAAVEFKKYRDLLGQMDMEGAKKALSKAKDFIDLAAAHDDTKESAKTLYYKGEIYSNFLVVGMQTADSTFMKKAGDDAFDQAIAAYKKGFAVSDKFDGDITTAINEKKMMLESFTQLMAQNKMYKDAIEVYDYQVKLSDAINIVDTLSMYNAGICANNAELPDVAATYFKKCADLGYHVPEIYKTVALCLIRAGKREEATAYLTQAIAKNPNDAELYYVIGTTYMETDDSEKVIANLNKAIELNPNYLDAQYNLGAYLLDLGSKLRKEANDLPLRDPKFQPMIDKSNEYFKMAVPPLEAFIKANPNEKQVLKSLMQLHGMLKNTEQEAAYKARYDALK